MFSIIFVSKSDFVQHRHLVQKMVHCRSFDCSYPWTLVVTVARHAVAKITASDETNFLQAVQLKAVYSSELKQCVIVETNNGLMAAIFIYSMSFDFVILVLTAVKLFSGSGYSRFRGFIFNDGLIYFVIAFVFRSLILLSHSSCQISFVANTIATVCLTSPKFIIHF